MNIVIFCAVILSVFAVKETPFFCKNCKFFRKPLFLDNSYGRCSLFPKMENDFYVTGNAENSLCLIARQAEDMCGKEGKMYQPNFFIPLQNSSKVCKCSK